jgi:hypothetical protein
MSEGQSGTYCTLRNWLVELPLESAAANDGELGKRLEKWTRQEMGKEGWIGEGEEEESEMGLSTEGMTCVMSPSETGGLLKA